MKHFAQMNIEKLPVVGRSGISFVGIIIPFVCFNKPLKLPLVIRIIPFVKNYGFTLVELMVVLAILAILATIAAPNMQDFIRRNRVATQINELLSDLTYTQSEAIHQINQTVTTVSMCSSTDGTTCTSTNWKNGWIVLAGTTTVLRANPGFKGGNTVTAAGTGPYQIDYVASGGSNSVVTGAIKSIKICDDANKYGRELAFNNAVGGMSLPSSKPATSCP